MHSVPDTTASGAQRTSGAAPCAAALPDSAPDVASAAAIATPRKDLLTVVLPWSSSPADARALSVRSPRSRYLWGSGRYFGGGATRATVSSGPRVRANDPGWEEGLISTG